MEQEKNMKEYKKIRLKFSKTGAAKFISHLDLDRTMKTVITRSGLDAEFTHGYNPRPYLIFALPLPVGVGSECEFLDIRLSDDAPFEEIASRLNENLPGDIRITKAYPQSAPFKDIYSARYEYSLLSPTLTEDFPQRARELLNDPVIIEKHTKKTESGVMDFDIAPYIYEFSAGREGGRVKIDAVLSAAAGSYINPENLIRAFEKYLNVSFDDPANDDYTVLRTAVCKEDKTDFE